MITEAPHTFKEEENRPYLLVERRWAHGTRNITVAAFGKSHLPASLMVQSVKKKKKKKKNHLPRQETRFSPRVRKIPWRKKWQPTPVFLPGKSHGQRSLAGCRL